MELDFKSLECQGEAKLKQLVIDICKELVDNPDDVKVNQIDGEQITILELRVNPSDIGKVIGKMGRTINAIRTIVSYSGMMNKRRYNIDILDEKR